MEVFPAQKVRNIISPTAILTFSLPITVSVHQDMTIRKQRLLDERITESSLDTNSNQSF